MRLTRLAAAVTIAFAVACTNSDATAPLIDDGSPISLDGGALGLVAGAGGSVGATAMLPPLPADLPLTDAQRAQITQLISAFQDASKADMAALAAIQRKAEEARRAGKTEADIR